ncbi:MAG: S8 family serine peptidase [Candidatus Electrothrix aestuarii]|uniref:S8 family serine peptidase n=1 Tax=Candidatus Electrothrix aestuarii TaxID=3062594 RepID=A0AAU8LV86_9BACT|nr:S8 family serine peptidase [Candidatus Electrothrix aestuarii]
MNIINMLLRSKKRSVIHLVNAFFIAICFPSIILGESQVVTPVDTQENNSELTQTSHKLLPEVGVRVIIPEKKKVSDRLEKALLRRAFSFDSNTNFSRAFSLDTFNPSSFSVAEAADEVELIEIIRPQGIHLVNQTPFNRDARLTHKVPQFEATFHNGQGASILAAIFDGGAVRNTHQEFRVDMLSPDGNSASPIYRVDKRTSSPYSNHATHVAGTMAAQGVRDAARGMARKLRLLSFDWKDDLVNLEAVADHITVSNHSYGPFTGWSHNEELGGWIWWGNISHSDKEDSTFGKYTSDNAMLDNILYTHPELLTVVAAGNDRIDAPISQPERHYFIDGINPLTGQANWKISSDIRNADGFDQGGLDTISGLGVSKNVLCVGAINDQFRNGVQISETIKSTSFSNWGPTDDGRIKPDVVANGDTLLSLSSEDDDVYTEISGTSMASPTAAGIAALLAEFFITKQGRAPTSAELKGIIIHGAVDGGIPGPDPIFGWGAINALASGRIIAGNQGEIILSDTVEVGAVKEYSFAGTPKDVRVTLTWTDLPGCQVLKYVDTKIVTTSHQFSQNKSLQAFHS